MNRPSQKYTYLSDHHYESNRPILREFAKVCIEELRSNPDGIQLPLGFLQIIRRPNKQSTNQTLKNKFGEGYVMPNDHTDGDIITTRIKHVTDIYNNNNKYYSFKGARLFKMEWYKPLKKAQYLISQSLEYLNFKQG